MIDHTEKDLGRKVVYTGNRYPGGKLEEGVITSFNSATVFVRYGSDYGSKGTDRSDLEWGNPTMNDRLPGSSWSNPIWHREKWRIYLGDSEYGHQFTFQYSHDDYDGAFDAGDRRHGYGATIEACKQEIDREFYDENAA